MATTVNSTIKSAGGDYTTLSAWEAAKQGDLVAADEIQQAECFDLADTTAVDIAGSTTDATRYMRIYGTSALTGVWSTSRYRLSITTWNTQLLKLTDNYVRVEDIQVEFGGTQEIAIWYGINVAGDNCSLQRVIVRATSYSGAQTTIGVRAALIGAPLNLWNVLVYDCTQGTGAGFDAGSQLAHDRIIFLNCGAHNCDTGFVDGGTGFGHTIKNCWANDCTDGFNLGANTANNNASDIASDAPGTSAQTGSITFVDEAGDNFQPASGDTIAKGTGADLSGTFTTDLTSATRSAWDIGPLIAQVATSTHQSLLLLGVG